MTGTGAEAGKLVIQRDREFDYYIRIRLNDNTNDVVTPKVFTKNSNWFRIKATCQADSNTITDPSGLTNSSSTPQTQIYEINGATPYYLFPNFDETRGDYCPIGSYYYHYASPGSTAS